MKKYYIYSLLIMYFLHSIACKNNVVKEDGKAEKLSNDSHPTLPDTSVGESVLSNLVQENDGKNPHPDDEDKPSHTSDRIPEKGVNEQVEKDKPDTRPAPVPDKTEMLPDERINKQNEAPPVVAENIRKAADVRLYQNLLQEYVSASGKVNYAGIKKDIQILENYTSALSDDQGFEKGTEKEKLALWINTYNAYTLLMAARNYPINSIRDIHGGKPWDAVWIRIGKKNYSLNQIENDIIRPVFKEPRIHFVLNCAATSCPPLLNTAFTRGNLEILMETATKNFINSHRNIIREDKAEISPIFDWYREDFGNIIRFLNRYSDIKMKDKAKISYLKYDWSLND